MSEQISYKTHILIGVRENGVMAVIRDWPYVPKQVEVQEEIDAARNGYATFVLCTPTSIMPAQNGGSNSPGGYGSRQTM